MIVAGIDVGAPRKGFHGVLLGDGAPDGTLEVVEVLHSTSAAEIARWCRDRGAKAVGVDAPCRWRESAAVPRLAERELRREGIFCFFTPTRARAEELRRRAGERAGLGRGGFCDWMLNGAKLYEQLERDYRLFPAGSGIRGRARAVRTLDTSGGGRGSAAAAWQGPPVCFETFPHAIARILTGQPLSARKKRPDRRKLLLATGIDLSPLTNQDYLDAALCALAALLFAFGSSRGYGDSQTGMIVLPDLEADAVSSLTAAIRALEG